MITYKKCLDTFHHRRGYRTTMSPTKVIIYTTLMMLMMLMMMPRATQPIEPCCKLVQKFKQSPTKTDDKANEWIQDFSTKPPIEKHVRKRDMDRLDNENIKDNKSIWSLLISCRQQKHYRDKLTLCGAPDRLIAVVDHHPSEDTA